MFKSIFENVRANAPLVHSITNYVTVNDCANIILACGASPIMADDIAEMDDIATICTSHVINIGTLNARTIESMMLLGKKANVLGHPIVLDPVGAGASKLRNETTRNLLQNIQFSVVRGNISEIKFIAGGEGTTNGVDASVADTVTAENTHQVVSFAKQLSQSLGAVVAITGAIDIVADGTKAYVIKNGHPMMSRVTGTGCMLTALIGALIGANPRNLLDATACAVIMMGLAGEQAYEKVCATDAGTAMYRIYLLDAISKMDAAMLEAGVRIEVQ